MENLLIVHLVYTLFGGVSVVAGNLIKEQIKRGAQVAVAYVEYDKALEEQVGGNIEMFKISRPKYIGQNMLYGMNIKKVFTYFENKYPDKKVLIHAHNAQTVGVLSKLKGIPVVCTLHGLNPSTNIIRKKISNFLYRNILRRLKNNECSIISVSSKVKEFYDPKDKFNIKTIHNCTFLPKKQKEKNEQFVVGYIGDASYAKGFDILLKGFSLAAKERSEIKLIVAGKYKSISEEECKKTIDEYCINDKVECLGYVANASEKITPNLDMFVLASKNEGFPMSLVEAMSYGIPVLATNVGGIPEIVKDGYNGFFIQDEYDISNRISELCRDRSLYKKLSLNAKNTFLEKFEINKMVNSYNLEYNEVLLKCQKRQ